MTQKATVRQRRKEGRELKRIRKALKLSMQKFGAWMGYSFQSVWAWEHGKHEIPQPVWMCAQSALDNRPVPAPK